MKALISLTRGKERRRKRVSSEHHSNVSQLIILTIVFYIPRIIAWYQEDLQETRYIPRAEKMDICSCVQGGEFRTILMKYYREVFVPHFMRAELLKRILLYVFQQFYSIFACLLYIHIY